MNEEIKQIIETKFPVSDVDVVSRLLEVVNKNISRSNKSIRLREIENILTEKLK